MVTLGRDQEVRHIGLGDAPKGHRLHRLRAGQKAVAPAKGRALGNVQFPGNLIEREAFTQGLYMGHPFAAQVKPDQGGATQGVEGARALAALVTLQSIGRAVLDDGRAAAMRAEGRICHPSFDDLTGQRARAQRGKGCLKLLALVVGESGQLIDQTRHFTLSYCASPEADVLASRPEDEDKSRLKDTSLSFDRMSHAFSLRDLCQELAAG